MLSFEWDETKNRTNKIKHGITFEEAATVFYDINALVLDDPDHSIKESRFLIIGISRNSHVCIVSHCYRDSSNIIRIISARKATKREIKSYNGHIG